MVGCFWLHITVQRLRVFHSNASAFVCSSSATNVLTRWRCIYWCRSGNEWSHHHGWTHFQHLHFRGYYCNGTIFWNVRLCVLCFLFDSKRRHFKCVVVVITYTKDSDFKVAPRWTHSQRNLPVCLCVYLCVQPEQFVRHIIACFSYTLRILLHANGQGSQVT